MVTKATKWVALSAAIFAAALSVEVRGQDSYDVEAVDSTFRCWQTCIDFWIRRELTHRTEYAYELAYWA